ncbi:MAG: hypothetical protein HC793_01490 [Aquincola sp.]|nr:hypothetical protein [Aquincola sp.]
MEDKRAKQSRRNAGEEQSQYERNGCRKDERAGSAQAGQYHVSAKLRFFKGPLSTSEEKAQWSWRKEVSAENTRVGEASNRALRQHESSS